MLMTASSTRSRVVSRTLSLPCNTRDTVACETPAVRATVRLVTTLAPAALSVATAPPGIDARRQCLRTHGAVWPDGGATSTFSSEPFPTLGRDLTGRNDTVLTRHLVDQLAGRGP